MVQRFERKLQSAVGDVFARVFGGGVVPQEVEVALAQEAADQVRELDGGHLLVPNEYVITMNSSDHEKLSSDSELTTRAFSRHLEEHIREQGWQTYGPVVVRFEASPTLHTGQFRTRGSVDPDAGIQRTEQPQKTSAPPRTPSPARVIPPAPVVQPAQTVQPDQPVRTSTTGAGSMTQQPGHDPEHDGDDRRADEGFPAAANAAGVSRGRAADGTGGYGAEGGYRNGNSYSSPRASYGDEPFDRSSYEQAGFDRSEQDPRGRDPRAQDPRAQDPRAQDPRAQHPRAQDSRDQDQRGRDPRAYDQQGYDQQGRDQQGYGQQPPYDPRYDRQDYDRPGYDRQGHDRPGYDRPGNDRRDYDRPSAYDRGGYDDYSQREYDRARPDDRRPEPRAYDQPAGYDRGGYAPRPAFDPAGPPTAGYQQPAFQDDDYDYADDGTAERSGLAATLQLEDGSGRYFQLREGTNVIGRGQDAQFRLPDTGVSRRHIEIRWDGRVAMLSDLGSTNGTTVNGAQVQEWQLADGDVVRAGHSEILVRIV